MTLTCNITKYPNDHESRLPSEITCICPAIYSWEEPGIRRTYHACKKCAVKVFGPRETKRLLALDAVVKDPLFKGVCLSDPE